MAKTTFIINAPDKTKAEIEADMVTLATARGWTEKIQNPEYDPEVEGSLEEIDNPVTAKDFVKEIVANFLKDQMRAIAADEGARAGRSQALATVNADLEKYDSTLSVE